MNSAAYDIDQAGNVLCTYTKVPGDEQIKTVRLRPDLFPSCVILPC